MNPKILKFFSIFIICSLFFIPAKYGSASWADHLVISEVQMGGQTADDEFIELFNSGDISVNLTGCYIKKKNNTGNESNLVVSSRFENKIIQARSFLLLAPEENYQGNVEPDIRWPKSYKLSSDNTIIFYNNSGIIIDKIGWGAAMDFEASPFPTNPQNTQSLERKTSSYSTASTLTSESQEKNSGNGWDTDNNATDFVLQTAPSPQNTTSTPETTPPLSGPPPVCDNDGTCETDENNQNCPNDCPVCGNGTKETGEDCDGTDLNQKTCLLLGWAGGSLSCNSDCAFNTSNCNSGGGGGGYSPSPNSTNPSDIVINELVSDPADDSGEWIELYNNKSEKISLENWYLEDGSETRTKLNGEIDSKSFFVVSNLKFYLNNKGDIVFLKDANGNLIDSVAYGNWNDGNLTDNAEVANDPASLARKKDGVDTNNDLNDFNIALTPTKGKPNADVDKNENQNVGNVYLNEILPNPIGDDKAGEFIELKNISDQDIDLAGWKIEDASGASHSISTKDFSSTIIASHKFFVLKREISGIALNNTGNEAIKLYNSSGQLVDSISYAGSVKENFAYARNEDKEWQWTNQPTLGAENIFTENPASSENQSEAEIIAKIIISEVLPNPVGSDDEEWLEIYNADSQEINLKNWQVDDIDGGSSPYKISKDLIIKPGEYLVFKKDETKISFNNNEDSVRLISPLGKVVNQVSYEDVIEGFSYARDGDDWFWTSILTPGAENIISEEIEEIIVEGLEKEIINTELSEVRQQGLGTKVKVRGVVSVEPGILGSQIFYLAGSGIQIYFYKKDFPNLKIGDLVEITGELTESRGETRIKVAKREDIKILKNSARPTAKEIKIGEIGEELEGGLVSITGEMIESRTNYFYLDDGTDEIKVYLKQTTGIKKPKMKEGDLVKVVGIVSQNNDEYRILPRFQEDIEIIKKEEAASSKETTGALSEALGALSGENNLFGRINNLGNTKYLLVSALALLIILIGLLIKNRKKI